MWHTPVAQKSNEKNIKIEKMKKEIFENKR